MKKIRSLWIAVMLAAAVSFPAMADLIWVPENDFLSEHDKECEYSGRRYYVNGKKGYGCVYENPESRLLLDRIPNGEILYVTEIYTGGSEESGIVQYRWNESDQIENDYTYPAEPGVQVGWIPMSELLAIYDSESFMEEHEDQITEAEGKMLTSSQLQQYDAIYFWEYPGARESIEKFEKPEEDMEFDRLYRDEDGTEWGHVSNYLFRRDFWIQVSQPDSSAPSGKAPDEPELIPAVSQEELKKLPASEDGGINLMAAAGIMVFLVMAVSGGLIIKMSRGKGGHR